MKFDRVIAVRNTRIIYRDGDRCVKVFNEDYSKADVLNEALNQARVEETGLNIPEVLEVTMLEGKWAIVSRYVTGKTLDRLMDEQPQRREEYLRLMVELQLGVNTKSCAKLNRLCDLLSQRIDESGLDAAMRFGLRARLEAMPKSGCICHGDFNPSNIIISTDGAAYLLDWSRAAQGCAGADAAVTYLQFRLNGDSEGAAKYLELYCEKGNVPTQEVRRWIPIVAAARSVKGNMKEREFMLSCVNNTDFI